VARTTRRYDEPDREDAGGRVVLALVLGLALLTGVAYVGAYFAASDKIPVGTRVAGIDIGGHRPGNAVSALRDGLSGRAGTPFTVTVNGHTRQVRPEQVGLGVDYDATVRNAGAVRSWRPSRLWAYYTDGSTYQPVVTFDQGKLAALVQRLDAVDGRTPKDGAVVFHRRTFVVRPPRPGLVLDPRSVGTAFWNAYLSDDPSVQLPLASTDPMIDDAAIHRFIRSFANPAVSSSVLLHVGRASVRLAPADYAHLLGARRAGHDLRPTVRAHALASLTHRRLAGNALVRPQDATVALAHGRPHVVRARPGLTFTPDAVAAALLRAIGSPDRTARVRVTATPAAFTTAEARHLGIRRQVSAYTVHLPGGQADSVLTAARRLDGTVLRPGDTLSLRGRLGARTPEDTAGAALATAVFNAAWLGGLPVTAHAESASYAGDYPMGRDASLRNGQDLAFADRSPYGVLVATTAHGDSLTVGLWSTPRWSVTSSHGPRSHVVEPRLVVRHARHCASRAGHDGFEVTVTRTLDPLGSQAAARTTSYSVRYAPVSKVVCHR
jgi:vancomycin resistance protein YoaR